MIKHDTRSSLSLKQPKSNYWWIENFGVVPLLRLAAFLLAPARLVLRFLLSVVARVFETIRNLLSLLANHYQYLPILLQTVKMILWINFLLMPCFAEHVLSQIQISIGEVKEIQIKDLSNFMVADKEILNAKYHPRKKVLWIKGKSNGYTEIIVWNKNGLKHHFQTYVATKKKIIELAQIAQSASLAGLQTSWTGPILSIKGLLQNASDYRIIKKLIQTEPELIHNEIKITDQLRNELIGQIYKMAFDEYYDDLSCLIKQIDLICYYPESNPPSTSIQNIWINDYGVKFLAQRTHDKNSNYRLKLKIIQMEETTGREINFGLNQLSANFSELFSNGIGALIANNSVFLGEANVELSTLAEPDGIIMLDKEAIFEIGSEIPYQNSRSKNNEIQWKFVGLKIGITLTRIGKNLQISYKVNFSKPQDDGSLGDNKGHSSVGITTGEAIKIFEIGHQTSGQGINGIPVIKEVPIIGKLFSSKKMHRTYKKITGVLLLEKYEKYDQNK